MAEIITLLR